MRDEGGHNLTDRLMANGTVLVRAGGPHDPEAVSGGRQNVRGGQLAICPKGGRAGRRSRRSFALTIQQVSTRPGNLVQVYRFSSTHHATNCWRVSRWATNTLFCSFPFRIDEAASAQDSNTLCLASYFSWDRPWFVAYSQVRTQPEAVHSGRDEVVAAGQAGQPSAKNGLVNIYWTGSKLQVPARPPRNFTCLFRFDGHRCNRASRPRGGVPWGHMGIGESRSVVRHWATLLTTSGHIPGHHIGHLLTSTDSGSFALNSRSTHGFDPKKPSPMMDGANLATLLFDRTT